MLPRYRSLYAKFIVLALVAVCFVLYIKVLQVEHAVENMNVISELQQQQPQLPELQDNEIPHGLEEQLQPATESPYEQSILDDLQKQQWGLGADGEAAHLTGLAKERGNEIYKKIALNEELSERLPYNRTLADARHPDCKRIEYNVHALPSASVIIIFYNEPYSVLVRTVHSTLNTCHGKLLKEIILVDDGSTNIELHGKLDYYIKSRIPSGKVKVLRLKNR